MNRSSTRAKRRASSLIALERLKIAHTTIDTILLTHLHGDGNQCLEAIEDRRPWRRWLHHCTLYGFGLCFISTTIAAVYHLVFGWHAPYAYTSAPVLFGAAGGVGLLIGPAGLFVLRRRRDPDLGDAEQGGLDVSFILLLFASSATGLVLMVLRERAAIVNHRTAQADIERLVDAVLAAGRSRSARAA